MATAPAEKPTTQVLTGNDTPMGVDGKESKDTVIEAPKVEAPKVEDPAPETPKTKGPVMIRAVYGRMVDPFTALEFTQAPRELYKKTSWVQSQLDAGKLELVKD